MKLIVILNLKDKREYSDAFAGTGKETGPQHNRIYVHTGELYVCKYNPDKTEKVIHTFAAGQWKEFYHEE